MSAGEMAGLVVLAGSCGLVAGVTAAALVFGRQLRGTERQPRRVEAYTNWLGAHLTASRASLSFVAAFRALDAERSDSVYFALRTAEAQRARAYWCDAMQRLDAAEAALIVLGATDPECNSPEGFIRVRPDALRRAINGDEGDVDELAQRLYAEDRVAIGFVRSTIAAGKITAKRSVFGEVLVDAGKRFKAIIGRWGSAD